ncbi:hypothetical protein GF374_00275 [Candidatus Woesearchaeota archaeon]|nr:hypothetical protein [Candidatus Woesearchaeota archaeon]
MRKGGKKKEDVFLVALEIILVVCVIGLISDSLPSSGNLLTGQATTQTTTSQVTIQNYLSISSSSNLSAGVDFGTINSLPVTNQNATNNYNSSNNTEYSIAVSTDSNTNVDFCIHASELNTTGGDVIGLGNYSWEDDSVNNLTAPATYGQANLNTSTYAVGSTGVTPGNDNYYRFWLNITVAQPPGTYNNTLFFKGVPTGDGCN